MEKVGVRQLRTKLSYYLKKAKKGEGVVVTDRGTSIAVLLPAAEGPPEEALKRLVALNFASWRGGKPQGAAHPVPITGKSVAQIVLEERR